MIQGDPFGQGYDPKMGIPGGMAGAAGVPAAGAQRTPDALDALIEKLLAQQGQGTGGGLAQRTGPLNVPFGPMSTRPNPLQFLLRGAVSGYNGRAGASGANPKIEQLLRLQESKRYHDAQIGNTTADNTRADAAEKRFTDAEAARQQDRETDNQRMERLAQSMLSDRSTDNDRQGRQLAEQARHNRSMEGAAFGNLAERRKNDARVAAGGGAAGGKGASPYTSNKAYYDGIADSMVESAKTKIKGKHKQEKTIAAIRAWQAQQTRDLALHETDRRNGGAPAAPQSSGSTLDILNDETP